jgi:threonine aldolase
VNNEDGTIDPEAIQAAVRPDDSHHPVTRLILLENTHNRCGGMPLTVDYTNRIARLASAHNLKLHLDGARIFNAAVALEVEVRDLAGPADSLTFCLSKGLSAPVGSVLCGSESLIKRAHRLRKQLGGGMRQAGIIAAAGIQALKEPLMQIQADHRRARLLAKGLSETPGLIIDSGVPATNMVYLSYQSQALSLSSREFAQQLKEKGVLVGIVGSNRFRLVTHYGIEDQDIDQTVNTFAAVMQQFSA